MSGASKSRTISSDELTQITGIPETIQRALQSVNDFPQPILIGPDKGRYLRSDANSWIKRTRKMAKKNNALKLRTTPDGRVTREIVRGDE